MANDFSDDKPQVKLHDPSPVTKGEALGEILAKARKAVELAEKANNADREHRKADGILHDAVRKHVGEGVLKLNTAYSIDGQTIWLQKVGPNDIQCTMLDNDNE